MSIWIHAYSRTSIDAQSHTCTHAYIHTHMQKFVHTFVHSHMHYTIFLHDRTWSALHMGIDVSLTYARQVIIWALSNVQISLVDIFWSDRWPLRLIAVINQVMSMVRARCLINFAANLSTLHTLHGLTSSSPMKPPFWLVPKPHLMFREAFYHQAWERKPGFGERGEHHGTVGIPSWTLQGDDTIQLGTLGTHPQAWHGMFINQPGVLDPESLGLFKWSWGFSSPFSHH